VIIIITAIRTVMGLGKEGHDHEESHRITAQGGVIILEIFEDGVPRFRLRRETGSSLSAHSSVIETIRPDGTRQQFSMVEREPFKANRSIICQGGYCHCPAP
jgi:hypothetical protein